MDEALKLFMAEQPFFVLFLVIAFSIFLLGKGADLIVEEAVLLAKRWGVPTILIGATIISLGTTLPEAAVSVFAAIEGKPDLALGNAVGSIICDTGLILGIATLISPLPLRREIVNHQGWIQLGAGFLLVFFSLPLSSLENTFKEGGRLPQGVGMLFLLLLFIYISSTIRRARKENARVPNDAEGGMEKGQSAVLLLLFKLAGAIFLVVLSSKILIPAVEETALRIGVPNSIIAATLVAFGTSLPELVTALTAVRKGHGELAVGNIIGADILNVLFVAGAAATVTKGGLTATPDFFKFLFPAMLLVLIIFRVGIFLSGDRLKRPFGVILLGVYVGVTVLSYLRVAT